MQSAGQTPAAPDRQLPASTVAPPRRTGRTPPEGHAARRPLVAAVSQHHVAPAGSGAGESRTVPAERMGVNLRDNEGEGMSISI